MGLNMFFWYLHNQQESRHWLKTKTETGIHQDACGVLKWIISLGGHQPVTQMRTIHDHVFNKTSMIHTQQPVDTPSTCTKKTYACTEGMPWRMFHFPTVYHAGSQIPGSPSPRWQEQRLPCGLMPSQVGDREAVALTPCGGSQVVDCGSLTSFQDCPATGSCMTGWRITTDDSLWLMLLDGGWWSAFMMMDENDGWWCLMMKTMGDDDVWWAKWWVMMRGAWWWRTGGDDRLMTDWWWVVDGLLMDWWWIQEDGWLVVDEWWLTWHSNNPFQEWQLTSQMVQV